MSVFDSVVKRVQGLAARGVAASGNPVQVGGTYRSSPAAVDDGDAVDLLMDSSGRIQVTLGGALEAGDNNIGNVDIVTVPAPLSVVGNGTALAAMRVTVASDSTGLVALAAGSAAIGKLVANSGVDIGDVDVLSLPASTNTLEVVGDAAHDAAIAGNPVRIGGRAISADVAAVATGDTADLVTDLTGHLVVSPHAPYSYFLKGVTADITDTTATSVIAAAGSGFRIYVTSLLITNSDADTGTVVKLTDGSGGATLWRGYAASAGGGFAQEFSVPIFTTANTALYAECETTGATVQVSAAGYKGR